MRKISKKLLSLALALVMVLGMVPAVALAAEPTSGKCGDNVTWSLEDGVLTISGTGPMWNFQSIESASSSYGYVNIMIIGSGSHAVGNSKTAPWQRASIKTVKISNGVTSIGQYSFEKCNNLSDISIPSSITKIEKNAFSGCTSLTDVYYSGTNDRWNTISIDTGNDVLINVTIHFNSVGLDEIAPIRFDQGYSYIINNGESITFPCSVPNPNRLTKDDVIFISSDPSVASVATANDFNLSEMDLLSFTLNVTGLKAGTTTITASTPDGRTASCNVTVRPVVENTDGSGSVIASPYEISVGKSGRSYAPIPEWLKETKFAWRWESSDSNIVSLSKKGILGEINEEGTPSKTVSVRFHALAVGTATLTCSVEGKVLYSQKIIVVNSDSKKSTIIVSNDYNVPQNATDKFKKEFAKIEVAYRKLLEGVQDILNHPGKYMEVPPEPTIEEQANALMEHDSTVGKGSRYLYFRPGDGTSFEKTIPDELKKFCYQALCTELAEDAKKAKFSLKDISLDDPFHADVVKEVGRFISDHKHENHFYTDSHGNTITVKINTVFYNMLGTLKCYPDTSSEHVCYSADIMPQYEDAESLAKAYLNELIDLEYRAQKHVREVLMKEVIKFSFSELADCHFADIKKKLSPTKLELESLQLNGFDSTVEDCYNYAKTMKDLKDTIESNPTDLDGIITSIENLPVGEIPNLGKSLVRLVSRFSTARKNFRENILKIYHLTETAVGSSSRLISFACPINIGVYKDDRQIGYVGTDDIWYNSEITIEENGNGATIYCKPQDTLSFEITGTDDGTMNYTIEDYEDDSPVGRVISNSIPVKKDQLFTGVFPGTNLEQNQRSFALKSDNKIILPAEYIPVSEHARVDIDTKVAPANSGRAYGNGAYVRGDVVTLYELPRDGYIFSGWYDNSGELISQEPIYDFSAKEKCTLEARFSAHSDELDGMPTVTSTDVTFTDVPANAWYHDPVYWAAEKKVTTGTSETTFTPDRVCTETEILTFLWRAAGKPGSSAKLPFTVNASLKFAEAPLRWAYEKGMIDGSYNQTAPCTRAAAAKFIWQAAGSPNATGGGFTDVPAGADYAQAVAWAVKQGITQGTGDAAFSPNATCTRAEIVTFLHRAY